MQQYGTLTRSSSDKDLNNVLHGAGRIGSGTETVETNSVPSDFRRDVPDRKDRPTV